MFGLTNAEGNHGEDVKEYYFYLDATPTSSYLKYRYRYPLGEFPYDDLVATNAGRGRLDFEYELLDTGVFDDDRYVDVDVEYAKAAPDDVLVRITLVEPQRGAGDGAPAADAVVPQHLVDGRTEGRRCARRRRRRASSPPSTRTSASSSCAATASRRCCSPRTRRTPSGCGARRTPPPYVKDAFHELRRRRPGRRRQPGPDRHQGGRALPCSTCRRAAPRSVQLRLCRAGATALDAGGGRHGVRRPDRRGRRVLRARSRRRPRPPTRRRSCARRWPGCCGASSSTTSTSTAGSRSTTSTRCATAAGPTSATAAGSTWSTTT